MKFTSDQTFKVSKDVLFQNVSGEIVLLDLASEAYFGLDAVGARAWGLLSDGKNFGQMLDVLTAEYEVERQRLHADVQELLERLLEEGLIST